MSLTDIVSDADKKMSKETGLPSEFYAFQHIYNPMNMYCRLCDLGYHPQRAKVMSKMYEDVFYRALIRGLELKYNKDNNEV